MIDDLLGVLDRGSVKEQLMALAQVRALALVDDDFPFDRVLDALRSRPPFADKSREVRQAFYEVKKVVAIARGKARGLRHPRPDTDLGSFGDKQLFWGAIEIVRDAVSIYDGVDVLNAGLALATASQRHFYAIWWTISEVCNGGFHQYFLNPTGIVAPVALDGFRQLGVPAAASALERACAPFGKIDIQNHEARCRVLERLEEGAFEESDSSFHDAYEDAFRLGAAKIRSHASEFFE